MGLLSFRKSVDPTLYCSEELLAKDLSGKTIIVTGGNSGFGKLISDQLVKQGAKVIIAGRRLAACEEAAAELNAKGYPGSCTVSLLDLASLDSVRAFAERFIAEHDRLDVLVENAAVCCVGNSPLPGSGFEPHLGINHYGHFLLRHLLTPLLASSSPSRVVTVGSALHDRMFTQEPTSLDLTAEPEYLGWTTDEKIGQLQQWMAYSRSKLANVLSASAAGEALSAQGVTIVSVHPGVDASTGLFRAMPKGAWFMRFFGSFFGVQTTWQSVQTILHCTLEDESSLQPGAFYSQYYQSKYRDGATGGWPMTSPNPLVNAKDAAALEAISYKVLGLTPPKGAASSESSKLDAIAVPATPTTEELM